MLTSIVALCLSAVVSAYHVGDGLTPGNVTAAGRAPEPGITVACERSLPLGTRVFIDGLGERVCHDRMHLRYEGGAMNFDVYAHSTEAALKWGRQTRAYRVVSRPPGATVQVWRRKVAWATCQSAAGPTGTWMAAHCYPPPGPNLTIYIGTERVTRWSVDPTRDLAHANVGADPSVFMRPTVEGELATAGPLSLVARGYRWLTIAPGGYLPSADGVGFASRDWCVTAGRLIRGMSGTGIHGSDGALLGIVIGGSIGFGGEALAVPECAGRQRAIGVEVP